MSELWDGDLVVQLVERIGFGLVVWAVAFGFLVRGYDFMRRFFG